MKILYLLSSADLAGAEICFLRLIKELIKKDKIEIFVINQEDGKLNDILKELGIKVFIIPSIYLKKIYKYTEIIKFIKNIYLFKSLLNSEKPHIIHAFTLPLSRRILFLKLIGINIPIVGTIHDSLDPKHFGKMKTKLFVYSINKYYKYLIAVSESTKKIAIQQGIFPNKIKIIYNGIEIKEIETRTKEEKKNFVVGCFGRITENKGQLVLLKAALVIRNSIQNLKILIVGKPSMGIKGSVEYYNKLVKFVYDNNMMKNVQFIEWTNNIEYYYKMLDVYVLPSIYEDPFPTVILEAMLYKIPVIATNLGGAKEQIENGITGFLIKHNDHIELAEKILFLFKNPKISEYLVDNAYKKVRRDFNMKKWIDEHLDVYKNILSSNN